MNKKLLPVVLALLMVAVMAVSCSATPTPAATSAPTEAPTTAAESAAPTSAAATSAAATSDTPATLDPITITVYTWLSAEEGWGAKSKGDIKCFQELEKRTNVKVNWDMMTDTNTFDLMMSSGDVPDVIWYSWAPFRQTKYAKVGLLLDVRKLVEENGPNIEKVLGNYPVARKQLVNPQGQQYLIPWITADKTLQFGEGYSIRQDWLTKLSLQKPNTADEFLNVMEAFRNNDANGNGQKDEIMTGYPSQIYKLFYSFGCNDGWQLADDGKTVVFGPTTDSYKNALKWFAKLYTDGILDPDYLSQDSDIYNKKVMANQVGFYCDNVGVIGSFIKNANAAGTPMDFQPLAYLQYNGKSVSYNTASKRVAQQYGSCISTKAKDPARIVKWLDYMYSDEGSLLMNYGIEGTSYTMKDGKPVYTEAVTNDPKYDPGTARSQFCEPTWCGPQSGDADLAMLDDLGRSFRTTWANVDNANAMEPYIWYDDLQQTVIDNNNTNLTTEQSTWRDQFITGQKNIDTDWDAYITALNGMGLPELTVAYQKGLETYQATK